VVHQHSKVARTERSGRAWARYANLVLSIWLLASVFAWEHSKPSRIATALAGLLMVTASLSAIEIASMRWLNFTLAFGLFFATWSLPHATTITPWNNAIAALLIFAMSLVPSRDMSARLRASSSRRHTPRS
jgi:hypothetical protein